MQQPQRSLEIPLVLASASPRRIELLSKFTTSFIAVPSRIDEVANGSPEEQVIAIARDKVREVARQQEGIIIGADTIVELDGEILGKPHTRDVARKMLMRLSGREHRVLTGLFLLSTATGDYCQACEMTLVRFRPLSEREIEAYLNSDEYADKAGAYAIQGRASVFVDRICGDFFNVMGLPLCRLVLLLRELGLDLLAEPSIP
jgi:septum formation protein